MEVFLAAFQNPALTSLSAERQLAWLRRVARNKVIDHYRHTALFTIQPLEQTPPPEDQSLTPERHAEAQETRTWLVQTIKRLPDEQRELLRLRYVQELRLTQIATLMEKPEGSVRKMLSRILRHLQRMGQKAPDLVSRGMNGLRLPCLLGRVDGGILRVRTFVPHPEERGS